MENLKIENLRKNLYTGDFGDCFCDYDNGYICDIISEIADNHVDIYNSDLLEWAKDNYSYIEEALSEFGTPEYNGHADFIKIIQQGQYFAYEQELYENLEDNIRLFIFNYIENVLNIQEITQKELDCIEDEIDFEDNNEQLENIIDTINKIFEKNI